MARASLAIPTRFLVAPDKLDIKRHKLGILYIPSLFKTFQGAFDLNENFNMSYYCTYVDIQKFNIKYLVMYKVQMHTGVIS